MGSATTKRDVVRRIAAETNTPRPVVKQIVQQLLDDIVEDLARGRRIEFREFGVFEPVERGPRKARNPRTGEAIHVPAKTVVNFRPGSAMRERVGALSVTDEAPPVGKAPLRPSAEGGPTLPEARGSDERLPPRGEGSGESGEEDREEGREGGGQSGTPPGLPWRT